MRKAEVFYNDKVAGYLFENKGKFFFKYEEQYLQDKKNPPISLTLPKSKKMIISKYLFPFFSGFLPEGENENLSLEVESNANDDFNKLLIYAYHDTIGGITIREI
jgi:serine/threonine-protein kinase HipA